MIRVLLADDHEIFLYALAQLVERDSRLEVVGRATTAEQAIELAERLRPDAVMLDVVMPGMGGLEAAKRIRELFPGTGVVLISGLEQEEFASRAAEVGASVWLTKQDAISLLPDALADSVPGAAGEPDAPMLPLAARPQA